MGLYVGTSGFSFAGWRAQVYPDTLKSSQMFDYYCHNLGFGAVELNSTFYAIPSARAMASLATRSPDDFRFMVKLYQAFTHNLSDITQAVFERFRSALRPLEEAGKLKGLLAQFPPQFMPSRKAMEWIFRLRDRFCTQPLFVEFRHPAWDREEAFRLLRREKIGFCIPDLPRFDSLPRFRPQVTNDTAYIRLHGRNPEWYTPSTSRYDYQYSGAELHSIYQAISSLDPAPVDIYFFFNNCHGAAAVRSARKLLALSQKVRQLGIFH